MTEKHIEEIARAMAWTSLTEKGRATSKWPADWGAHELRVYRAEARAAYLATLRGLTEPSYESAESAYRAVDALGGGAAAVGPEEVVAIWRAMISHLIAEAEKP